MIAKIIFPTLSNLCSESKFLAIFSFRKLLDTKILNKAMLSKDKLSFHSICIEAHLKPF